MLAKQDRLTKQKDFEKIFKQGKSYYSKLISMKAMANQLNGNRYGIVISTKVSKKSVKRNKIKRQISQIVRRIDHGLAQGFDLAIIIAPAMLDLDCKAIAGEVERLLAKLKPLKQ